MARRNQTADPHRAYSRDGVQLALGRHWKEGIVHVATVPDGADCGCECPACGRKLIAREGTRRRHFAHARIDGGGRDDFNCDGGQMTALHLFAQRLLVEKKALTLPAVAGGHGDERIEWRRAEEWTFDHSTMEEAVGSIRPDVILSTANSRLHVEILVTHACSPEKVEAVRAKGLAMVEIDLSKADRDIDLPGLENLILHGADRRWIYNRRIVQIEAIIVREREKRRREEAERERQRRTRAIDDLKTAYRRAERAALADKPQADPQVRRADEGGWKGLISGFPALAPGLLTVHPERWRTMILLSVLDDSFGQSASLIAAALELRGVVNAEVQRRLLLARDDRDDAKLPAHDITAVVEDYLRVLEAAGAARCVDGRWTRGQSLQRLLQAQGAREAKRKAELAERRRRIDRLARLLEEIGSELPSVANFSEREKAWRDVPLWGSTPLEIAQVGGDHWIDLERGLGSILGCMRDGSPDPAPPTLGLPHVAEAMGRGIARWHQRAAEDRERARRLEAEQAAELARQADQRAADIRKEAVASLGDEAEVWLSAYVVGRRATPEELARRSSSALRHARDALRDAVALRKDMNRSGGRRGW